MLTRILRVTAGIILLRMGPQDFPYAREAGRIVVPAAVLANFLQLRLTQDAVPALVLSAIEPLALALAAVALLQMRGLVHRAQQTVHALLATGAVFALAMVPIVAELAPLLADAAQDPAVLEQVPAWLRWSAVILSLWNLVAMAHILRHALDTRFAVGLLAALGCVIFVFFVVQLAASGLA